MRKNIFYIACVLLLIGCKKNDEGLFELKIISNELLSNQNKPAKSILRYKLTNNSNKTFYFNQYPWSIMLSKYKALLGCSNCCLIIKDKNNNLIKTWCGCTMTTPEYSAFLEDRLEPIRELGYTKNEEIIFGSRNFTIHPKETLFFEELVYLPFDKFKICGFHSIKENSFGSIIMFSDTTKLKSVISVPAMQTIKENKYVVFHGVIESINKIPIKIVNVSSI